MSPAPGPGRLSLREGTRAAVRAWLAPPARALARAGVPPNAITAAGLILTAVGAVHFARGQFPAGSLWAAAGGLCDALDGAVAREQGRESRWGAFLDSVLDRVSDTLLFLGVAAFYFYRPVLASTSLVRPIELRVLGHQPVDDWLRGVAALAALAGAYLVSYARARAEGLGEECRVGWFERPERLLVLLGAGLFGTGVFMDYALLFLAVMSWITVLQRVLHVRRRLGPAAPRAGARGS